MPEDEKGSEVTYDYEDVTAEAKENDFIRDKDLQILNGYQDVLSILWQEIKDRDVAIKELLVRHWMPIKPVSEFVVIKQSTISWRIKRIMSPWAAHIQQLYFPDIDGKGNPSPLYVRYIWSKHGKYFFKMAPLFTPSTISILCALTVEWGYTESFVDSICKPF